MNTFGKQYTISTFGESHGKAVGGVIDGCPAGIKIDVEFVQSELNRRRPGQSKITTPRDEADQVQFLSGIFEGETTGTPIGFIVNNKDQHSKDYNNMKEVYRPSHADYTYEQKYGRRDHRGGGRSSARETISRVVGGAVAKLVLQQLGIEINGYVNSVAEIELDIPYFQLDFEKTETNIVRCPDESTAKKMIEKIEWAGRNHNTVGGTIGCVIKGVPAGWGSPVFNKLHADLGFAMLGINAVKGFEYGSGFDGTKMYGSDHNDVFINEDGKVKTVTNHSGGIQGGISNGQDIYMKVAFKPIATLLREQKTIDRSLNETTINPKGRHDPCVLPRAVPIVESMAALVIVDHYLQSKQSQL